MVSDHRVKTPKGQGEAPVLNHLLRHTLIHITTPTASGTVIYGEDAKFVVYASKYAAWVYKAPNMCMANLTKWARKNHYDLWIMSIAAGEEIDAPLLG